MSSHWSDAPRLQLRLHVNYRQGLVEVNHVDGESHAQSMNAMAGNNPEAVAVTEVMVGPTQQAAEAAPVGVGDGEGGGEIRLPGSIEGLPLCRKHHPAPIGSAPISFPVGANEEARPDPTAGSIR